MRRKLLFLLTAVAVLVSCSNNDGANENGSVPEISGSITDVNMYGMPIPSFTPQEMKDKGFDYADLLHVKIGDKIDIDSIPFLTSFNEAGSFDLTYVDYNALGMMYCFGMLNADFHLFVGGDPGDKVTITMTQKGGYKEKYDLLKSTFPAEMRPGETPEQYANFRVVSTTGMGKNILYRSSNPINCRDNRGRYRVVDSLASVAGIKTEIDLADTKDAIEGYMKTDGYASTYCPQLYKNGSTMACGLSLNIFGEAFQKTIGDMVKFMIVNPQPYLIHCNEGKDRCGFVTMLLEAFMGADIAELRSDYMQTMINFYHIEKDGESYMLRQKISIDRMIWALCHEDIISNLQAVDWSKADITTISKEELREAAKRYFKGGGVSDEKLEQLRTLLAPQTTE